ncbi:hypothetical protein AMR42_02685 [Limnothrix sp. PR1529]|uniref:GTPase domain-containing protein n=1 Tax=Limnothrix sp. PR1529 TaxID=1704291 RepID=UPI00081EBB59|nr:GTPase domain-containing protein [Limnothrix sp. PR1529]OCQ96694.1 hypothetical protein BCR12_07940 [Limnothrix sp. P13C2]PIB15050.1 hypothetical protein AMR42_02685 [Limnothrix sp. PR1529]
MQNFKTTESTKQLVGKLKEGLKIAFIGEVNTGKSSTINAITGEEIAIVSIVTGSTVTNDEYEAPTLSKAIRLIDTPGLRAPGVDAALYRGADFIIYFVNASAGWTASAKTDFFLLKEIYGSHIAIAISKVDTVVPADDWLKIRDQIKRDLGSLSPNIIGICSLPGKEIGIEELKEEISKGLEDSQKAFLFNLILRSKSKDCDSIIRETMFKVASLAASGIPIHEIPKFDEEIIQMIQKIILACQAITNLSQDDLEDSELRAKNFYSEFHQELGWKFDFVKWGSGVLKAAGGLAGTVIVPGFGTATGYGVGISMQVVCYLACAYMIGLRAKKLYSDNSRVPLNELESLAKKMVKGLISEKNVENFIRRFTTEL